MKKKILIISIIILSLVVITLLGIFIYVHISFKSNVPVLAYHNVLESVNADTDISIKNFENQIKWLKDNKYKVLTLDELYEWKENDKEFSSKKIVITFDDGKSGVYENAIPILEKYEMPATIFVIESRIDTNDYLTSEQIEDIKENHPLISLESHSYDLHIEEKANSDDYDTYYDDLKGIEDRNYSYYAYPFGISNDNYVDALKDNDYKLAFKFSPSKWVSRKDDNYNLGRVPVYNSTSMLKFKLKVLIKK